MAHKVSRRALVAAPALALDYGPSLAQTDVKPFDEPITAFMAKHQIPGAGLVVMIDGKPVIQKGYGLADKEAQTPASENTLFRLASVSKPITGVAVMKLVEQGKLQLEQTMQSLLAVTPHTRQGAVPDERLRKITVRHLLQHTAGWNRDNSGDPMFEHIQAARDLKIGLPLTHEQLISWQLGKRLDSDPGSAYAYSNFGYCLLGRIIEKITGRTYEAFVKEAILDPAGATVMRIGKGKPEERFPSESVYYHQRNAESRPWWRMDGPNVPQPYGFQSPEMMDAHGGWIASAADLGRLLAKLDAPGTRPLLLPSTVRDMFAPPPPPVSREADGKLKPTWYGCGWSVRDVGQGRLNTWHFGAMSGTSTMLIRRNDGISWALLFNQRAPEGDEGMRRMEREMHQAATTIRRG